MKILVYDTETNGVDIKTCKILELAFALYDVSLEGTWRLVESSSYLLDWSKLNGYANPELDTTIRNLTGIQEEMLLRYGKDPNWVFSELQQISNEADYWAGQNAIMFDLPLLIKNAQSAGFNNLEPLPHIDSYFDLPKHMTPKSLKYLALDCGYVMNNAHEALADVQACAHVLSKGDIHHYESRASMALIKNSIGIKYGDQKTKDILYSLKYRWNQDTKTYQKICREEDLKEVLGLGEYQSSEFIYLPSSPHTHKSVLSTGDNNTSHPHKTDPESQLRIGSL